MFFLTVYLIKSATKTCHKIQKNCCQVFRHFPKVPSKNKRLGSFTKKGKAGQRNAWMSQEVSKWDIYIYVYIYIYVITHLLTIDPNFQRDILVVASPNVNFSSQTETHTLVLQGDFCKTEFLLENFLSTTSNGSSSKDPFLTHTVSGETRILFAGISGFFETHFPFACLKLLIEMMFISGGVEHRTCFLVFALFWGGPQGSTQPTTNYPPCKGQAKLLVRRCGAKHAKGWKHQR